MMSSMALMILVLVAECYCVPGKFIFGKQLIYMAGTNVTAGVNIAAGKNKDGVWTVDGELIVGANVTGEATLDAYVGLNDNIVRFMLSGGGTLGIEAKPGIHSEAGVDHDGVIRLGIQPRLPINIFGNPGFNGELAYGEDAKEAIVGTRAHENNNIRDKESVQKSPNTYRHQEEHTQSPYRVQMITTTYRYNNERDHDYSQFTEDTTTAVATLD